MKYKYPRTQHLPWSPGASRDDLVLSRCLDFQGKQVVVTEKMDGENTSIYTDTLHARSIESGYHASRNWVKALQARIGYRIPPGWRICGENLYAKHSLHYQGLPSYFLAFSVWNADNLCLSWQATLDFLAELELQTPKVLYQGVWQEKAIQGITLDTEVCEGYVVRLADAFTYENFARSVAKWVRPNHVTTDKHWRHQPIQVNGLRQHHE